MEEKIFPWNNETDLVTRVGRVWENLVVKSVWGRTKEHKYFLGGGGLEKFKLYNTYNSIKILVNNSLLPQGAITYKH